MSVSFTDTEWVVQSVAGATLAAVASTISQMNEAAKTQFWPSYVYESTEGLLSTVTVTVATRVTLPQWAGYNDASTAEQQEWDRFCSALRAHEQGHLDLVSSNLSSVDEQLLGKSVPDAATAWRSALQTLASATIDYDNTTDHGRNQGTIIDLGNAASPADL